MIKMEFPLLKACLPAYLFVDIDIIMPVCTAVFERAIATQIQSHLINNDIVDNFQSAYKAGNTCETALLRVYTDIVTTIGRGNGVMLILLDLSAAFDTIDHDNLFCILEKYVVNLW